MKLLLFIVLILFVHNVSAQHPTYYIFAEQQLKGVDVYDVIQDEELNYWFATDQGIIKHDGYSFEKTSCPNMKGASVFGFVKDRKGIIYCFNLHQQIFRIIDAKIELYAQIPEEMEHHEISLLIDHDDNLLIQSSGLMRIRQGTGKVEIVQKEILNQESPGSFHLLPDGSTISASTSSSIAHQKNGKVTQINSKNINVTADHTLDSPLSWVTVKNRVFAIERNNLEVFEFNTKKFTFSYVTTLNKELENQALRAHATEDQIWLSGISNGTYVFDIDFKPLFNGKVIYPSKFISDFFTDAEGNLLLSTFDDGIIVLPNTDILGYALPKNEKIIHVTSDQRTSLFISTNLGNIYHFKNGAIQLLYSDPSQKSNEGMEYWKEQDILLFYTSKSARFARWDGKKLNYLNEIYGAFKNAHFSDNSRGLIALNFGITAVEASPDGTLKFSDFKELRKRAYCVVRDQNTNTIYSGISNGLVRLTQSGKLEAMTFQGRAVYPNSMTHYKGKTYVGTKENGVLIYENDRLKKQIPHEGQIRKVLIYLDELYLLSNSGLHITDLNGKNCKRLNNSAGLSFDYVSDFHITKGTLYITDSKSLQYISLDKLFTQPAIIPIHFKKILVNGKVPNGVVFNSDQRKITLSFNVSTLRFRDNITYKYKLEGYDKEWQIARYEENSVTYNALSPGKYTFIVHSLNGSVQSKPIRYSFTIDAPFHQKWWFYLLIFLVTGLGMAMVNNYRIKKIKKKNGDRLEKQKIQTEMLESELKALRSQMNPHFIFNALNSIQDLILKEETDASYDYIVLFADLVRSTLNYSNKDFIDIDKELEFIKVYLSLEKLRFKEEFEYTIEANNIGDIKVPSLLIQPFIENALIHGLIHKEGLKTLSIEFNMQNEKLTCSIRDNGIGRARSKEIQTRQGNHESFALNAIEQRLAILNRQNDYACGFVIVDLEENGQSTGTEVVVTLPYKHLF